MVRAVKRAPHAVGDSTRAYFFLLDAMGMSLRLSLEVRLWGCNLECLPLAMSFGDVSGLPLGIGDGS